MEIRAQGLEKKSAPRLWHWSSWIGYAALAWSIVYGIVHLYWLLGGEGYPFIQEEMVMFSAMVMYLPAQAGRIAFVVLCSLGVFFGIAMHKAWGRVVPYWLIMTYAWGLAAVLLLFVPDSSLIMIMAYAFLFKFDFSWLIFNQIICIIGALLWIFAAVSYFRRVRQACTYCGRTENGKAFVLVRWGKWITYIAAFAPIPYACTRIVWAFGVAFGVDSQFFEVNPMAQITSLVFGGICIGGGLLTLGLIQKWGEVFPRWFPFVGGKRVPILLAVIPASIVAIAVTAAGVVFTFTFFAIQLQLMPAEGILLNDIWGTIGPMLLWIPWGTALGLAAISYYYRRRGRCKYCNGSEC